MGTEDDHIERTIATYDVIAPHYHVTATPELRDWEESSMRLFADFLGGTSVLVPGCGDGRDSRYYKYFEREELISHLRQFRVLHERLLRHAEKGIEFWMGKA